MAVQNFGTGVDGSVFVEQVPSTPPGDTDPTDAPQRPGRGLTLKVRDDATGVDLPDITTEDYGYWDYQTDDIPLIRVSGDDWATYVVVVSAEARNAAATASVDVTTALTTANEALTKADEALLLAQQAGGGNVESVNGQTGSVILTAAQVGARPTGTAIPATDVSGLANVATSGAYGDLSGRPAASIPATEKGTANGVATLGVDGKITTSQVPSYLGIRDIFQAADGTWPLRNSVTTDTAVRVSWWYYSATSPDPEYLNGYVQANDVLYKKV